MSSAYVEDMQDEDHARLLQEEINRVENGRAEPNLGLGHEPPLENKAEAPRRAGVVGRGPVRQTAMTVMYQRFKLASLIVSTMLALPQLIAICVLLPQNWHFGACDSPIGVWLILLAVRLFFHVIVVYVSYFKPTGCHQCQGFDQVLNIMQFALLLLGVVWIIQSKTCPANDPVTFKLAYYLFICLVCIICIPMALFILILPLAFCCTPYLHSLMQYWFTDRRGADETVISNLTSETFKEGRFPKSDATCSICSADYQDGEPIRVLPCAVPGSSRAAMMAAQHHFHKSCIDKWLRINSSCPICRHPIGPRREEDVPEDPHV